MDLLSFAYVLFVCTPPAVLQSFPELLNWTALIRVKKTTYIIYPSLFSSLFALQQIWLSLSLRICVGLSIFRIIDYVKSVSIPSFSGPFFPHSDWIRTRKTLNTDIFHSVVFFCFGIRFFNFILNDLAFFDPSFIPPFPSISSNFLLFSLFDYFVCIICKTISAILE